MRRRRSRSSARARRSRGRTSTLRALFLLGALTAAGVFAFWLLMRRLFADELRGLVARLLFFALFTAFVGAGGLVQTTTGGTRFALFVKLAAIVAVAGAAAAALAGSRAPRCSRSRGCCAVALAAIPAFAGHARRPRLTAVARRSGRPAASRIGRRLDRRAADAARRPPRSRSETRRRASGGTPVLDGRTRRRRRPRRERRRPQPERARLGQPALVDLVRAGAASSRPPSSSRSSASAG